jgi:hypothetical protein
LVDSDRQTPDRELGSGSWRNVAIGALVLNALWLGRGVVDPGFRNLDVTGIVYNARLLLRGLLPYLDSTEVKPPGAFDGQASDSATLVEIVAEDRPGLLSDLASTISSAGCSIDVVLIDTEAHKALDVFYITKDGAKLTPDLHENLRRQILTVCND